MEMAGIAGLVAFISFLGWAFTGSFAATTIRDCWPDLYEKAGAPKPIDFWAKRLGPGAFDAFTMFRQFRSSNVENGDLLFQLEIVCWLRWLQVIAMVVFFFSLFSSL